MEEKTFSVIEYCTGDFGDLGSHVGEINAFSREEAKIKFQKEKNITDAEIGFYGFSEIVPAKDFVDEAKSVIAKQEKIKEAWGDRYEIYKEYINENGWIENGMLGGSNFVLTEPFDKNYIGNKNETFNYSKIIFRPKSLQGIENNNGWIKIESEEDLPKIEMQDCFIMDKKMGVIVGRFTLSEKSIWLENATYYQPIEKPKPPIY